MKIAIRKEPNGSIYIDKTALQRLDEETLKQPPYNYSFVEVEKDDCESCDFNDDLTFNIEKYNTRKQLEEDQKRIPEIQSRLDQLSQDIVQDMAGEDVPDIENRKAEFIELHNELRVLLGKDERKIK